MASELDKLQKAERDAVAALGKAQNAAAAVQGRIADAMAAGDISAASLAHAEIQPAADLVATAEAWLATVRAQIHAVSVRVHHAELVERLADINRQVDQIRKVLDADVELTVAEVGALQSAIRSALSTEDQLGRLITERHRTPGFGRWQRPHRDASVAASDDDPAGREPGPQRAQQHARPAAKLGKDDMDNELWKARAEVLTAGMGEHAARGRDWVQQTQLRLAVEHLPDDQQRHLASAIREALAERAGTAQRPVKETGARSARAVSEAECPPSCLDWATMCAACRARCN